MTWPLVEVTWSDAWSDDIDGADLADWPTDCPVVTVGYLVRDTGKVLSVAAEIVHLPNHDDPLFRAVTHIPAPWIVSVCDVA